MPARPCSIARTLELIGERWSILALRELFYGVHRFDQIAENTGASRDILAARLRKLVDAGVLEKRLYEEHPPRYEYHLTGSGRDLYGVLLMLMAWGDRHLAEGEAPAIWQHRCGADLEPRVCCPACGDQVRPSRADLWLRKAARAPA